jgi:hypothetical protein
MRRLFADAFYWIALLHVGDQWHHRVVQFAETLEAHHLSQSGPAARGMLVGNRRAQRAWLLAASRPVWMIRETYN